MQCFTPLRIRNPKTGEYIVVPCGKCVACLSNKQQEWALRLSEEIKVSSSAKFITLTYSDDKLPRNDLGFPTLVKKDVQDFLGRLRSRLRYYGLDNKIRYYVCGEYGPQTFRPHYHMLLFNYPFNVDIKLEILKDWQNGENITISSANAARCAYITKYMLAYNDSFQDYLDKTGVEKPFSLMSRRPGIGLSFINKSNKSYYRAHAQPFVSIQSGVKVRMPRYYRDKIYDKITSKCIGVRARNRAYILEKDQYEKDCKNYSSDSVIAPKTQQMMYFTEKVISKNNKRKL